MATPVTIPDVPMVAIDGFAETHTPPVTALPKARVLPTQTGVLPVMVPAEGSVLTVNSIVVVAEPHVLVTV
jgi:hypothetical protein